jgi:hypothetical protein
MKLINKYYYLLVLLIMLFSTNIISATGLITCAPTSINVGYQGGNYSITVSNWSESNLSWMAYANVLWCEFAANNGTIYYDDDLSLHIHIYDNVSVARTCTITIIVSNGSITETHTISVTQTAAPSSAIHLRGTDKFCVRSFPNPFNPFANIEYEISQNGFATENVYDITAYEVAILTDGIKETENYSTKLWFTSVKWNLFS